MIILSKFLSFNFPILYLGKPVCIPVNIVVTVAVAVGAVAVAAEDSTGESIFRFFLGRKGSDYTCTLDAEISTKSSDNDPIWARNELISFAIVSLISL